MKSACSGTERMIRALSRKGFRKASILEEGEPDPEISSKAKWCNFFLQLNALDTLHLPWAYPHFCRKAIASSKH